MQQHRYDEEFRAEDGRIVRVIAERTKNRIHVTRSDEDGLAMISLTEREASRLLQALVVIGVE
jgi:hypothetical protein